MDSNKRIPALDGVRGLAILLVFVFHYGGGNHSSNGLVRFAGFAVQAGWSGVTLFFILSGFLITGILWDSRGSEGWWKNFYLRRLLRISPLYYLSLAIVLCGALWEGHARFAFGSIWVYALYLQNIPPFTAWSTNCGSPFGLWHFWSLAVEEQFYLVWPFLISRARSVRQVQGLCVVLFVASLLFRWFGASAGVNVGNLVVVLPSRMGELALGGLLAMAYRESWWRSLQRWAMPAALTFLAGFLLLAVALHGFSLGAATEVVFGVALASLFWAGFVVLALGDGAVSRAMRVGWLRWMGGISYGVYVYHVLLMGIIDHAAAKIAPHAGRQGVEALRAVLAIAVVFPVAWASFHFFEAPIMRLRRHSPKTAVETNAALAAQKHAAP